MKEHYLAVNPETGKAYFVECSLDEIDSALAANASELPRNESYMSVPDMNLYPIRNNSLGFRKLLWDESDCWRILNSRLQQRYEFNINPLIKKTNDDIINKCPFFITSDSSEAIQFIDDDEKTLLMKIIDLPPITDKREQNLVPDYANGPFLYIKSSINEYHKKINFSFLQRKAIVYDSNGEIEKYIKIPEDLYSDLYDQFGNILVAGEGDFCDDYLTEMQKEYPGKTCLYIRVRSRKHDDKMERFQVLYDVWYYSPETANIVRGIEYTLFCNAKDIEKFYEGRTYLLVLENDFSNNYEFNSEKDETN